MKNLLTIIISSILITCCGQTPQNNKKANTHKINPIINPTGTTIETRFNLPENYKRTPLDAQSFGEYLRKTPLKPHGTKVKYYNGKIKEPNGIYIAVLDIDVGTKDLQQCADAIMRLRAEYFYAKKQFDKIHFNLTNGFNAKYSEWKNGNRVVFQGGKTVWKKTEQPSTSYPSFRKYLELVFSYAGTLSLAKELKKREIRDLTVGDIFIRGGSPGHAVLVVDVAVNDKGEKIFLLAQSYMPAQDIQILENPNDSQLSPWYSVNFDNVLETPQWTFSKDELKRFE